MRLIRLRPRWRVQTAGVGIALLAILLSGYVQVDRWRREERAARHALMRSLPERRVRQFFTPRGVAILKGPTRVETIEDGTGAGRVLDEETAGAVARVLLDGTGYFRCDDFPEPAGGLRFWNGNQAVDVLFGLSAGSHIDIWNNRGEGWYCLENREFARLIEATFDGTKGP